MYELAKERDTEWRSKRREVTAVATTGVFPVAGIACRRAAEANMCGGLQRGQIINKIHDAPGVMDASSLPSAPAWSLVAASASAIRPHRLPAVSGAAVKLGVKS